MPTENEPDATTAHGEDINRTTPHHSRDSDPTVREAAVRMVLREHNWPEVAGYEITGEIASGGMGVVYAARDLSLNRVVAIKTLLPQFAGQPSYAAHFEREAGLTALLQHPGIPPVHALGTLADGRPFLAMKLIRGQTLSDELTTRKSPAADLPRFIHVFEQVCQAVGFAHSQGVIHRDLKPANVMVGAFGEVQVMDWGLGKRLRSPDAETVPNGTGMPGIDDADDPHQTRPGQVLGTPAYMAPEQARGEAADERADVFALGAMLCEILTGHPPYTGKSTYELISQAAAGYLSEALRRLDECGADAELVALARQCMRVRPEARPADARAVAEAVAAYRDGVEERLRVAHAERAAAAATAAEQRRKRRWQLALLLSLFAVAGTATAAVWMWNAGQAREREQAAKRANAEFEAAFADALVTGDLSKGIRLVDAAEGAQSALSPKARFAAAQALEALGHTEESRKRLTALLAAEDLPAELRPRVELQLADALLGVDDAKALQLIAAARASAFLPPADLHYADAIGEKSMPLVITRLQEAIKIDPKHFPARRLLGASLTVSGRLDEAIQVCKETQALVGNHPDVLWPMYLAHGFKGNAKETREIFERLRPHLRKDLIPAFELLTKYLPKLNAVFMESLGGSPDPDGDPQKALDELLQQGAVANPNQSTTEALHSWMSRLPPAARGALDMYLELMTTITIPGRDYFGELAADGERLARMKAELDQRPEGFMRFVYAFTLTWKAEGYKNLNGSQGWHGRRYRELSKVAGDAYMLAADTPGLIDIRDVALEGAILAYGVAGGAVTGQNADPAAYARAVEAIRRRLDSPNPLPTGRFAPFARIATSAESWTTGRRLLDEWEKRAPGDPAIWPQRAETEFKAGAYGTALAAARQALAKDPTNDAIRNIEADCLARMRELAATTRPHAPPPREVKRYAPPPREVKR